MPLQVNAIRQTMRTSSFLLRRLSVATKNSPARNALIPASCNGVTNYCQSFSTTAPNVQKDADEVEVVFIKGNGERVKAKGKVGDSLLDVVVNNSLDFDGFGACEGTLTCSTCHLILKPDDYDRLSEKPGDEECDMLDLAYELCDTSRLGCQITLTKELNGIELRVPSTINDARAAPQS